jgi:protein SCO1/2
MKIILATIIVGLAFCGGCRPAYSPEPDRPVPSSIVPKTPKLTSFDLTDQDGQPFNSKSLAGEPWVGSFFFTQCPAVCWRLNQMLAKWQTDHPESTLKFVSITCDPQTDNPAALKLYAKHFKADPNRWTFLTGDMSYISKVGQDIFMLAVQKGTHSSRAVVFDRAGKMRGSFDVVDPEQYKKFEALVAEVETE